MKAPLLLLTIPFSLAFLAGAFDWYFEDGFYVLLGFSMLLGIVWGWVVELKK